MPETLVLTDIGICNGRRYYTQLRSGARNESVAQILTNDTTPDLLNVIRGHFSWGYYACEY